MVKDSFTAFLVGSFVSLITIINPQIGRAHV